ncbi:MAG: hypothetical protein OXC61_03600 [Flavobacteriaceae bacterium]|nr:hypothetical protein [Flavobacteriaceae bacterium]
MAKKPTEKLPFESLPNHENIPLELYLRVDRVMGEVFKKANIPSNIHSDGSAIPKSQRTHSRSIHKSH